ncbi:ParB/RepB/Spo0J family partition protein [Escherichia coli]|nr:ParB/RepB/Spo0J family partition protein [Escherichia coli]
MSVKTTEKPSEAAKPSGLNLGGLGDLSNLMSAPKPTAANEGPQQLDMTLIDEDPNQPRKQDNPGFSKESIAELGATIKARGVKSPISVRENPEAPGRFIINHGARRFRGSKWAEKNTIPGFIDNDYLEADQVIENLQRNELTAREIADYIGREQAKGKTQVQIAKELGKSAPFVSQHVTLLDLPEPLAKAFNSGRVNDVTVINELAKVYKKSPEAVTDLLEDETQEVTRGSVKLLREFLSEKNQGSDDDGSDNGGDDDEGGEGPDTGGKPPKKPPAEPDPTKFKKAIVQVDHNGRLARLILNKRPSENGHAWMKYEDDGEEFEAPLCDATMTQIIEG